MATVVALVGVVIGGTFLVSSATGQAADLPQVRSVVRAAIADHYSAATFPPNWAVGPLPDSRRAQMHRDLDAILQLHMTGEALAQLQRSLHAAIDRESDGAHLIAVAGGVDQINYTSVSVGDNAGTVTGTAHAWSQWVVHGQAQTMGANSGREAAWESFTAHVISLQGRWLVDQLTLKRLVAAPDVSS